MKLALDTNAYCLCDTGHEWALAVVASATELYLPAIAYGELYYGFKHGKRFRANLARLSRFVYEFRVTVVAATLDVAQLYGEVFTALRKRGRPIPTNDVWIAASAMLVGAALLTSDKHFFAIEQIRVEWLDEA
jgi:tRNA(fMet)-specific endonuclease VapC